MVDDLIEEFIEDRSVYCREKSIKYYRENLARYLSWLQSEQLQIFDEGSYRRYVLYLRKQNITNVTIATYIRAVKVFYKWCYQMKHIDKDLTEYVKLPRSDQRVIEPLFNDEVAKIDAYLERTELYKRNYIIFHLMLDCGLRRGEVIALKPENIDFIHGCIIVNQTKSKLPRAVPIPEVLQNRYSFFRELFRNEVTEDMVKTLFNRIKKRTGLTKVHPHLLRHTFATSFIAQGGNMELLRIYLGHTDYNITRQYIHIAQMYSFNKEQLYKVDSVFLWHF